MYDDENAFTGWSPESYDYSFLDSEPASYEPGGYNSGWDSSEHYGYEAGPSYYDDYLSGDYGSSGNLDSGGYYQDGVYYGALRSTNAGSSGYGTAIPWGSGDSSRSGSSSGVSTRSAQAANSGGRDSWTSQTTSTVMSPTKAMPTMGNIPAYQAPTYNLPEYDERRVSALRQIKASPKINQLRGAVSEAITRGISTDNPYLRKLLMRDTLKGFGQGLENVMMGAETAAENEYYSKEYLPAVEKARTEYEGSLRGSLAEYSANIQRETNIYEAALKDYLASMTQTTTTTRR